MEQIAPGILQYVGLDGTVYYEGPDGNLVLGAEQYAFGYPGVLPDHDYQEEHFRQENIGHELQTEAPQNEVSLLNKQHLN